MKTLLLIALATIAALTALTVIAEDHKKFTGDLDPQAPINVQVQMCTLNPGKTMAQYDRLIAKYFEWSKKYDVETTFIRSKRFLTHQGPNDRSNTEFTEFLASDHETSGKAWKLWLTTPDGQKLNNEWASIATCDVKMATVYTRWADIDAMNSSDNDSRLAMWNWCSLKDGVSMQSLMDKHDSLAKNYPEGIGNIAWFGFFPSIGGANAPGTFANVMIFPDTEALMEHKQWIAEGGWRVRQDYYNYVDCQGDYVNFEEVMHRPGG